jgi:hypothetical protein
MISTAQKKARENFKKAIEYRKKTGCTLKQAFAHIKGKHTVTKKVGAVKKKAVKKKVLISPLKKSAKKKAAPKKAAKKPNLKYRGTLKSEGGKKMYKYSLGKKPTENTILNKIHKVKHEVESLDEAQHKHMAGVGNVIGKVKDELLSIRNLENRINSLMLSKKHTKYPAIKKVYTNSIKKLKDLLKEHKIHLTQLKKHI